MKPKLLTWNSININDGNPLRSSIPVLQMANLHANVITAPRVGDDPYLSDTALREHVFSIEVYIGSGQNINTNREVLKGYFNIRDKVRHNLVIKDENDSDRQYYLTGYPIDVISQGENYPNAFIVHFGVEHNYWQLVTATSDSWDITASGDSDAVTNIGNIEVPPIFTITPLTTKTKGLKYRRFVAIHNNLDKTFSEPLEFTNGFDAKTVVDNGKLQNGGIDFRLWYDGSFLDIWTNGMDSDNDPGQAWGNISLLPRKEGTILSIFDSDDTTLVFTQTKDNLHFLQSLKNVNNPILALGSDSDMEAIVFDPTDIDLIEYQITGITRGAKTTTAISHAASSIVRHIEHDAWILHGDSDLSSQDVDNDFKPVIQLNNSRNHIWYFDTHFEESMKRTGRWMPEVLASRTGLSYCYTGYENAFADPAETMGLALVNSADFQQSNETGTLHWVFSHPAGINRVTYDGFKYRSGSWPAIVGLQYLQSGVAWFTLTNEVQPTNPYEWEYFSDHSADSDAVEVGGYETIRFVIDGLLSSVISELALIDFYPAYVSFDSDNVPTVNVGSENTINFFDFKLTNNTTGEYIKVKCPCPIGMALTIDCENKQAYLSDGSKVQVVLSDDDRDDWLNLASGTNNLQFDDTGTVSINIVITHRDRIM